MLPLFRWVTVGVFPGGGWCAHLVRQWADTTGWACHRRARWCLFTCLLLPSARAGSRWRICVRQLSQLPHYKVDLWVTDTYDCSSGGIRGGGYIFKGGIYLVVPLRMEGEYLIGHINRPYKHCFCCDPPCVSLFEFIYWYVIKVLVIWHIILAE